MQMCLGAAACALAVSGTPTGTHPHDCVDLCAECHLEPNQTALQRPQLTQIMMEVTYKQQRELIEKETGEQQERAGMLQRGEGGTRGPAAQGSRRHQAWC